MINYDYSKRYDLWDCALTNNDDDYTTTTMMIWWFDFTDVKHTEIKIQVKENALY